MERLIKEYIDMLNGAGNNLGFVPVYNQNYDIEYKFKGGFLGVVLKNSSLILEIRSSIYFKNQLPK